MILRALIAPAVNRKLNPSKGLDAIAKYRDIQ